MARLTSSSQPNQQYEDTIKAKEDIYLFLQRKGVENAGVGLGYNQDTKKWCLAVHLQNPLQNPDPELSKVLEGDWHGTEVRVKHVGSIVAY
jgi:hypothetical protein